MGLCHCPADALGLSKRCLLDEWAPTAGPVRANTTMHPMKDVARVLIVWLPSAKAR